MKDKKPLFRKCAISKWMWFQIKLALRARLILKSRIWFQTKLHSTQFNYHYELDTTQSYYHYLSFSWWKWINLKIKKKIQETKLHTIPRFPAGIICGQHRGSFAVQFGDHFLSGDHLSSGTICGPVQFSLLVQRMLLWQRIFWNHP